jgi:hypothetical protein
VGARRRFLRGSGLLSGFAAICMLASACSDGANSTLQYVLASYDYQFYQTAGAREECPSGYTPTSRDQWEAQFPTSAQRQAHLNRCLAINNRGPNCENIWEAPELGRDPLPYRSVTGRTSFGADLDGAANGGDTNASCSHEQFVSPDGEQGIDNQYYRFFGCDRFVQGGQHHSSDMARMRAQQYASARILLEVTGVDNLQNDPRVNVALYRGSTPLAVNASEDAVAWQTQHIDSRIPPIEMRGRIEDGELITEPTDAFWEGIGFDRRQLVRGMTLRLKLEGDRATGLRLGYIDINRLWQSYSRTAKWGGQIYGGSGPSAHAALQELADGYRDPETGSCTALSSALQLDFVRAHIVREGDGATVRSEREL